MHQLSIYYPFDPAARFDFDYYRETHMPMVMRLLADHGVTGYSVERGLPAADGTPPRYLAVCRLRCSDGGRLAEGMARHGAQLVADVPNYTDIRPVSQLGALD